MDIRVNSDTLTTPTQVEPVKVYFDLEKNRNIIKQENQDKAGIYRWVNIQNGKSYIGSSTQLYSRFKNYLNPGYISKTNVNSTIHKALLKYGYDQFKLEILEYWIGSVEELLIRVSICKL